MMTRRFLAVLALAAFAAGCRTSPGATPVSEAPAARLHRVERKAVTSKSASVHARAAATSYLITGDATQADAHASRALGIDANEPLALMLRAELAQERLDEGALADAALAVVLHAPQSPWVELASLHLQKLAQRSPVVDERIERALGGLDDLALGLRGQAAVRAREALLAVREGRNDHLAADKTRRALGVADAWTVIGPLGAFPLTDATSSSPFDDPRHALLATYPSPSGDVSSRVLTTGDGVLSVDQEPRLGDAFEALVDLDVKRGGEHLVSLRGATMATVWVDGVEVLARRGWPEVAPERSWGAVDLPVGKHRLRVRFTRSEASWFFLELPRVDGAPTSIAMTAPTPGDTPEFAPGVQAKAVSGGALAWANSVLHADPGDPVAAWARVLAMQADDSEVAQDALDNLIASVGGETLPVRSLRIDLVSKDADLPRATAKSLVQRDVDAILAQWPTNQRALLLRFEHAREDKQWEEAERFLNDAQAVAGPEQSHLLVRRAQLDLARGNRAAARVSADAALEIDPGRCDALGLRADLARADGELAAAKMLMPQLLGCPGGLGANASWLRGRGLLLESTHLLRRLLERHPSSLTARSQLADAQWAGGDFAGAVETLEPAIAMWPRRNDALMKLASLHELAGRKAEASAYRRRAVAINGADLSLARAVAFDDGTEVMAWAARDGIEAIDAYRASKVTSKAGAVQVLDSGALEVQNDGSAWERIHTIVNVLDKRGIDTWGEAHLPADAQVLTLRTVKADGRVLEAEIISGKDSISMPSLDPGDFVEAEWVRAHSARPASLPGWQGGQFFFQAEAMPFYESVYEVRAPKSVGLEVQASGTSVLPVENLDGDIVRFRHSVQTSPPFIREPMSVGDTELLPWVEAGVGAGEMETVKQFAEWALLSTRVTGEVRRLVQGLSALPPTERVRAVAERVRETVRGHSSSASFATGAGRVIASERGNRLVALKAALSAVGIPSRVVLVRPFTADPRGFRFPRGDLFSNAVLRVEPPGADVMWVDLSNRHAPIGILPSAMSALEGVFLPEPGEMPEKVMLPVAPPSQDRMVTTFDLSLNDDGTLVGTMTQTANGFDAAALRAALERTSLADLRRHQESVLASTFPRVVLEDLTVEDSGRPDSPIALVSKLRAPEYGLRPDGSVALPANFGAVRLGARFLSRGERSTPLLISSAHANEIHARLTLPEGVSVQPPPPVNLKTDLGSYDATFAVDGRVVSFDEKLVLERNRIMPERYRDLAVLASMVDAAQAREMFLVAAP